MTTSTNGLELGFTPAALEAALAHRASLEAGAGLSLRIWIAGKNCDGFQYGVAFDEPQTGDVRLEVEGLPVVVDAGTASFLSGSSVDFIDDERGRGFVVFNPRAKQFRGKFYLKKDPSDALDEDDHDHDDDHNHDPA